VNPAPLPAPRRFTCERCGFGFDEPSEFCPRCGAAQTAEAKHDASPATMLFWGFVALFSISLSAILITLNVEPQFVGAGAKFGFAALGFGLFCIWKFFRGGN